MYSLFRLLPAFNFQITDYATSAQPRAAKREFWASPYAHKSSAFILNLCDFHPLSEPNLHLLSRRLQSSYPHHNPHSHRKRPRLTLNKSYTPPYSPSDLVYALVSPNSSALSSTRHPQLVACRPNTTSTRATLAQFVRGRTLFACSLPILFALIATVSEGSIRSCRGSSKKKGVEETDKVALVLDSRSIYCRICPLRCRYRLWYPQYIAFGGGSLLCLSCGECAGYA